MEASTNLAQKGYTEERGSQPQKSLIAGSAPAAAGPILDGRRGKQALG